MSLSDNNRELLSEGMPAFLIPYEWMHSWLSYVKPKVPGLIKPDPFDCSNLLC